MANEKRLIDAYKLEDLVRSNAARYHHKDDVIAAIAGQSTVDAVEVVRCAKCKHSQMSEDGTVLCKLHSEYGERDERDGAFNVWMEPDDFCSYGERKEADHGQG